MLVELEEMKSDVIGSSVSQNSSSSIMVNFSTTLVMKPPAQMVQDSL
jgi:hypothetical protein